MCECNQQKRASERDKSIRFYALLTTTTTMFDRTLPENATRHDIDGVLKQVSFICLLSAKPYNFVVIIYLWIKTRIYVNGISTIFSCTFRNATDQFKDNFFFRIFTKFMHSTRTLLTLISVCTVNFFLLFLCNLHFTGCWMHLREKNHFCLRFNKNLFLNVIIQWKWNF